MITIWNTVTGTKLCSSQGTADEVLDAHARDQGWDSWAQWCAEGRAPEGELALVDDAGPAVFR